MPARPAAAVAAGPAQDKPRTGNAAAAWADRRPGGAADEVDGVVLPAPETGWPGSPLHVPAYH